MLGTNAPRKQSERREIMKTKSMVLRYKEHPDNLFACGECFLIIERKDKFCWSCGVQFKEERAYSKKELLED